VVRYHLTKIWGGSEQVLKEVGINCREVPRDKLPLTVVSDLCKLAPVSLRFLLGISDTASNRTLFVFNRRV
jgi:hypothetical protein